MRLADRASALLAPAGPIGRTMPGFEARPAQVQMARAVAETLEAGGVLLVEAPTGSGKGLAYLAALAAYLSRRHVFKAAASTATITLQEQLVRKDLPVVSDAVGGLPTALLKGMGRYLCLLKWRGLAFIPPADLETFGRWVTATKSGDQNELPFVPSWWGEVAADHGDCLGPACSLQLQCFALQAKEAARRAQLLVTNHHLLLLYRRFAGSATSPLPNTAPVVIDEGHHLADIATEVYGESCSDYALVALAQRLHGLAPSPKDPLHRQIESALAIHRGVMHVIRPKGFEPMPIPTLEPTIRDGYLETLRQLSGNIARRTWEVIRDRSGTSANERAAILIRMLDGYIAAILSILEPATGTASWVEPVQQRNVAMVLRNAPIDVGGSLDGLFDEGAPPAILCSATLAAGGSFAHLKAKLGIQRGRELILPPVFDYRAQMRYYLPRTPLDPDHKEFTDQVATELLSLLRASEGRALVLFTSYEQLRAVAERLRGKLPYTLLVQDQGSTTQLLQQFKEDVHSVLLATSRFWEGIDIPGEPCFTPGALVRTKLGYKPIEEVRSGEYVWTHRRRYRRVIAVMRRDHAGDLIVIEPYGGMPIYVTPSHPLLVSRYWRPKPGKPHQTSASLRWIQAGELTKKHALALPVGDWFLRLRPPGHGWSSGHRRLYARIPMAWTESDEFWELVGLWVAEGSLRRIAIKRGRRTGRARVHYAVTWGFGMHEADTLAARTAKLIHRVLGNRLPRVKVYGRETRIVVKNEAFARWLVRRVGTGAQRKRVPRRLLQSFVREHKIAFLQGYSTGDGHWDHRDKSWNVVTASQALAFGVRDLALMCGYTAQVRRAAHGMSRYKPDAVYWAVRWSDSERRATIVGRRVGTRDPFNLRYLIARPRAVRRAYYEGPVHNLSVEQDESYTLLNCCAHNCSLVAVVRLPFDVPTHPLTRARFEAARSRGENAFQTIVVPEAVMKLRQGVGRLIRATTDRGVVAILDGRVSTRSYGRRFMQALPPAPQVQSHDDVAAFLNRAPLVGSRR